MTMSQVPPISWHWVRWADTAPSQKDPQIPPLEWLPLDPAPVCMLCTCLTFGL